MMPTVAPMMGMATADDEPLPLPAAPAAGGAGVLDVNAEVVIDDLLSDGFTSEMLTASTVPFPSLPKNPHDAPLSSASIASAKSAAGHPPWAQALLRQHPRNGGSVRAHV